MLYKHIPKKRKSRYHLIDQKSGATYCKFENGSRRVKEVVSEPPYGKKLCSVCERLYQRQKHPSKKRRKQNRYEGASEFYKSKEWAELRFQMLKDATHCLCCGAKKGEARLTVDHIKPVWKYPELRLDSENMQILCMLCNKGKGGLDETDFREIPEVSLKDVVFTELIDETRTGKKLN